jgi:hypothetical protein
VRLEETTMTTLTLWEELEQRLLEAGLNEFNGRTGWVRCEPYQFPTALGTQQVWIWIKSDQGTATVTMLPFETLDDLWTRFLKEIQPLRQVSYFSRNRLDQTRAVAYASLTESEGVQGGTPLGTHCLELVAVSGPKALVDPVLHRAPPGAHYLEKFRVLAEKRGLKGAKVGLRARLVNA